MHTSLIFLLLPLFLLPACIMEEPPSAISQANADTDMIPSQHSTTGRKSFSITSESNAHAPERYDRRRAVEYARRYAEDPNPIVSYCMTRWSGLSSDCTNFVSQALWYGGLRMKYGGESGSGWWYAGACDDSGSSKSWRQVNRLIYWLVVESDLGEFTPIREIEEGDLIFYKLPDINGRCTDEFVFHHSTMVTGFGKEDNTPLVSYHSREVRDIPWNWSMRDSGFPGLGDACSYVAVHIRD